MAKKKRIIKAPFIVNDHQHNKRKGSKNDENVVWTNTKPKRIYFAVSQNTMNCHAHWSLLVVSWKTHTNKHTNKHTKRRKYYLVTNKTVILYLILFALWQRTITLFLNIRQMLCICRWHCHKKFKRPRKRNWLSSTGRRNLLDNIERLVQALIHLTLRLTTSLLKSKALPPPFTKQGCNDLNIITESQIAEGSRHQFILLIIFFYIILKQKALNRKNGKKPAKPGINSFRLLTHLLIIPRKE